MSRILGKPTDSHSAFDFDVVTDVPPPPVRRPDPAPQPDRAEAKRAQPEPALP